MDKLSILYVVIAGVSWGTSGIFSNLLKGLGFSSLHASSLRSIFAFLVLFCLIVLTDRKKLKTKPKELLLFACAGICSFASGSFYFASIVATSLSTAVTLMYTAPIMVMILSVLFLGERFTPVKLVAVLLAFAGCGLVTGIIGGLRFDAWGIILGLLSGLAYCLYTILTKISAKRGNDSMTTTLYAFLFGGFISLFFCNPAGMFSVAAEFPGMSALWALSIGVFSGALPYFFFTLSMRKLPAGVASAMSSIEPMTATIVSVVLYHERLTIGALIGIVCILLSVILLSRQKAES